MKYPPIQPWPALPAATDSDGTQRLIKFYLSDRRHRLSRVNIPPFVNQNRVRVAPQNPVRLSPAVIDEWCQA